LSGITTISNKTLHVNKAKDVAFDTWNPTGTISGGVCSQLYCHSDGTGWTSNNGDARTLTGRWKTISWTATVNCGTCHGSDATGRPTYTSYTTKANSHVAHAGEGGCEKCHYATTSNGTTITSVGRHANRFYDLTTTTGSAFSYTYAADGGTCLTISCHGGTNAKWGSSGSAGMDCIGCHSLQKVKTLGLAGITTIRQVVGVGGDFNMAQTWGSIIALKASRHLFGATTITKWDCVVCHAEGWGTAGSTNPANHKDANGLVNLRNVDTVNEAAGWAIDNKRWGSSRDAYYSGLDNFCLSCHDSNGARAISVNATNNGVYWNSVGGSRALEPFNTTDWQSGAWGSGLKGSTEFNAAPRKRVIDVKTQFFAGGASWDSKIWLTSNYNGNPSQHAVIGARYGAKNVRWNTSSGLAWGTVVLKKMGTIMRSVGETAVLSCADCHVLDSGKGAHGGSKSYNLQWHSGPSNALCWNCHASVVYDEAANATSFGISRINHASLCSDRPMDGTGWSSFGSGCMLCHAGAWHTNPNVWGTAGNNPNIRNNYGGIHGSWSTYQTGTQSYTRYRFLPGTYWKGSPGNAGNGANDVNWTTANLQYQCYFPSNAAYSNCSSHNGTAADTSSISTGRFVRPTKY
jgi:predicted CxxxxCH...CXXCH cytochrome family protein